MGGQAYVCAAGDQTHQGPDVAVDTGTGPGVQAKRELPSQLQHFLPGGTRDGVP